MHHGDRDKEALDIAGYFVTGIDREPDGLAAHSRAFKAQVQVAVQVGIEERSPFTAKEAEDRSLIHEEAPGSAVFRIIGLHGDEVRFRWGRGDEDAVREIGTEVPDTSRHSVSFQSLFHGTAAVLCER